MLWVNQYNFVQLEKKKICWFLTEGKSICCTYVYSNIRYFFCIKIVQILTLLFLEVHFSPNTHYQVFWIWHVQWLTANGLLYLLYFWNEVYQ